MREWLWNEFKQVARDFFMPMRRWWGWVAIIGFAVMMTWLSAH
jgi:hypothetical protein